MRWQSGIRPGHRWAVYIVPPDCI